MIIDFFNRGGGGGSADYATLAGESNKTKLLEGGSALPESANTGDVVAVAPTPALLSTRGTKGLRSANTTLGVYQYDGSAWNPIGGGETPDFTSLKPVSELPASAETGEVVALAETLDAYYSVTAPLSSVTFDGSVVLQLEIEYGTLTVSADVENDNNVFKISNGEDESVLRPTNIVTLPTTNENYLWTCGANDDIFNVSIYTGGGNPPVYFTENNITLNTCNAYLDTLAEEGTDGGVFQYDGTNWNKIGEGEGGDSRTVIAVNNLNDGNLDAANCGDVRAKYVLHDTIVTTGGTTPSSGETFPSDGTMKCSQFDSLDDINGLIWKNGPDVWQMSFSNDTMTATLLEGDGTRTASETTVDESGTVEGGDYHYTYLDGSQTTILEIANYGKNWEGFSTSQSMQDYIFTFIPGEANWTGEAVNTYKTAEGVWQYVEGEHKIGKFSPVTFDSDEFEAFGFVYFGDFASSTEIYIARYNTQNNTRKSVVINTNGEVEIYDHNGDLEQTISQGDTGDTTFNSYNHLYIYNDLANGYVGFEKGRYVRSLQTNDTISASGWVNIEHNEPYPWISNANANRAIVKVNQNGQVVEKYDVQVRTVRFNTTGYSAPSLVVRDTTGLPNNLFAPTTGGDAGQVLTSTGDSSEPTWATLIKSVKITSDAYEALVTKNPNTLYLIVDDE